MGVRDSVTSELVAPCGTASILVENAMEKSGEATGGGGGGAEELPPPQAAQASRGRARKMRARAGERRMQKPHDLFARRRRGCGERSDRRARPRTGPNGER